MPNIYEMPLAEPFEAANKEFAMAYLDKTRAANAGIVPYTSDEFYEDLYRAAGNYGLFAEALWAYFRMLYID